MDLHLWLAFATASLILVVIPGPTVFLVLAQALAHGRHVALATAAGVALGDIVAMSASLAGLGALVLASAGLFHLLKWIGAAWLVWMGIKAIRGARHARPAAVAMDDRSARDSRRGSFLQAFAVTALNPKSIIFFIAFVPQFLAPDAPLLPQFAILIPTFVVLGSLNALAWALLADGMRRRIARPAVLVWLARAGGGALVAMGLATATLRRAAS